MRAAKCRDSDDIDFLSASPKAARCPEVARVQEPSPKAPAHDRFTRLLQRLEPDPETLWEEARLRVELRGRGPRSGRCDARQAPRPADGVGHPD